MKKTEPPILFILSGLPASGKSTLSKFISKEYQEDRLENRRSEVENLQPLTWNDVITREFHEWNGHRITIDTAKKTMEETVTELLREIKNFLGN